MNIKYLPAAVLCLSPVLAAASETLDANNDGLLDLAEMQAGLPDLTAEQFTLMDINSDGALDDAELAAARADGFLPKTDG